MEICEYREKMFTVGFHITTNTVAYLRSYFYDLHRGICTTNSIILSPSKKSSTDSCSTL